MLPPKSQEEIISYSKGEVLFEQGDPGGDLYFIQRGTVEIYSEKNGREIILSKMSEGEIIGIMTCLTNEARMASARAADDIVVKRVKHDAIKKLMGNMPPWMKIVLKDFTFRLNHMNKNFSVAMEEIRNLKVNQISTFYTAMQLASAFGAVGKNRKKMIDEVPSVLIDETLEHLESVLLKPKAELQEIFDVFVDSGMAKAKIEQASKKMYLTLDNAEKLNNFVIFMQKAQTGKTKKLLRNPLSNKDTRVLKALVKFAQKMELNLSGNVRLPIKDLERNLEKLVGQKYDQGSIDHAAKFGLVEIESPGVNAKVVLVPMTLSRLLAHISAYKKLDKLEEKAKQERQNSTRNAA